MSTIRGDPTPCLGCRRRAASGGSRERAASHRLHCRSRAPRAVPRGSCARRLNPLSCQNYTMGESQLGHTAPLLLPLVPSPPPLQAVLRPRCQVNHRPAPRLLGFFSPAQPSLSSPLLVQCRNAVVELSFLRFSLPSFFTRRVWQKNKQIWCTYQHPAARSLLLHQPSAGRGSPQRGHRAAQRWREGESARRRSRSSYARQRRRCWLALRQRLTASRGASSCYSKQLTARRAGARLCARAHTCVQGTLAAGVDGS